MITSILFITFDGFFKEQGTDGRAAVRCGPGLSILRLLSEPFKGLHLRNPLCYNTFTLFYRGWR